MTAKKSHEEVIAEFWAIEPAPEQRAIVEAVQARLREWIPDDVSLADELIAERRAEAAREDAEEALYSSRDSEEAARRGDRRILGEEADA